MLAGLGLAVVVLGVGAWISIRAYRTGSNPEAQSPAQLADETERIVEERQRAQAEADRIKAETALIAEKRRQIEAEKDADRARLENERQRAADARAAEAERERQAREEAAAKEAAANAEADRKTRDLEEFERRKVMEIAARKQQAADERRQARVEWETASAAVRAASQEREDAQSVLAKAETADRIRNRTRVDGIQREIRQLQSQSAEISTRINTLQQQTPAGNNSEQFQLRAANQREIRQLQSQSADITTRISNLQKQSQPESGSHAAEHNQLRAAASREQEAKRRLAEAAAKATALGVELGAPKVVVDDSQLPLYILKDGTEIRARNVVDGGDELAIKDDAGKFHTVQKRDVKEIVKPDSRK